MLGCARFGVGKGGTGVRPRSVPIHRRRGAGVEATGATRRLFPPPLALFLIWVRFSSSLCAAGRVFLVWRGQGARAAGCRSVSQPDGARPWAAGLLRCSSNRPGPGAEGDGCGFPLSPPFPLAAGRGWGELCVAHRGRVSPLGIAFWRGDARRKQLACGHLLRARLLGTWRNPIASRTCPGQRGSRFWAVREFWGSPGSRRTS